MPVLSRIVQAVYRAFYPPVSKERVDEFYADVQTPQQLRAKIAQYGFQWQGELSWLDWNRTPAESLATPDKRINCGDYCGLFAEFFRRKGIDYHAFLLDNGTNPYGWWYEWHYALVFTFEDQLYIQSNNAIARIESEDNILGLFPQFKKMSLYLWM